MPSPMIRTQFPDSQMETALPALNAVTFERFNKYPKQYSRIFNVMSSRRAIEQFSAVSGFGLFSKVSAEGGQITFDDTKQMFDKTYKPDTWALGYAVSRELFDDDKFRIVSNMAKELGRSDRKSVV